MVEKAVLIFFVIFFSFVSGQNSIKRDTQLNELVLSEKNGKTEIGFNKKAEYYKGNFIFQKMLKRNIQMRKVSNTGKMESCEVTFVVERDGSLTAIEAFGSNEELNNEAVKAVLKIKGSWTAGEMNEMKVRSRIRFPLYVDFTKK